MGVYRVFKGVDRVFKGVGGYIGSYGGYMRINRDIGDIGIRFRGGRGV